MKLSEFMDFYVRPLTQLPPDTEVCLVDAGEELDIFYEKIDIRPDIKCIDIYLKHRKAENHGS